MISLRRPAAGSVAPGARSLGAPDSAVAVGGRTVRGGLRRALLVPVLLPVLAGALLAACGSEDDASVPTDPSGAAATGPTTPAVVENLAPEEGAALIEQLGSALTVIDVRTPAEFAEGHLDGATNLDLEGGAFTAALADLDHEAAYVVYCHSGRRSALAAQAMIDAGFTEVYDLGGIADWIGAGLPVVAG